jgi:hypothetical protein
MEQNKFTSNTCTASQQHYHHIFIHRFTSNLASIYEDNSANRQWGVSIKENECYHQIYNKNMPYHTNRTQGGRIHIPCQDENKEHRETVCSDLPVAEVPT